MSDLVTRSGGGAASLESFDPGAASPSASEVLLAGLRDWVKTHFGIVYQAEQAPIFASRVESVCRELGRDLVALHAAVVGGDRGVVARLAEAVSTNHTYFLREAEILECFVRDILPSLTRPEARIWSAAASSGDEAYTLAMLAREAVPESRLRLSILGTDISERQLRAAEEACYPPHQLALLSPERRARWFRPVGLGQQQVVPALRDLCTFRRMNLTQHPWPFERRFDVIFVRNVLFYFDRPTRARIVEAAWDVAEPGGWLVTSLTEPMLDITTRWRQVRPAVYRKVA